MTTDDRTDDWVADPVGAAVLAALERAGEDLATVPTDIRTTHLAAMVATGGGTSTGTRLGHDDGRSTVAGRVRKVLGLTTAKVALGGVVAAGAVAGLGATDSLPDPVQRRVADTAKLVGIDLPSPDNPAATVAPPDPPATSERPTDDAEDVTPPTDPGTDDDSTRRDGGRPGDDDVAGMPAEPPTPTPTAPPAPVPTPAPPDDPDRPGPARPTRPARPGATPDPTTPAGPSTAVPTEGADPRPTVAPSSPPPRPAAPPPPGPTGEPPADHDRQSNPTTTPRPRDDDRGVEASSTTAPSDATASDAADTDGSAEPGRPQR